MNIRSPYDWYRVAVSDIIQHGGGGLYNKYGTLFNLFSSIYPEYPMNYIILHLEDLTGQNGIFMEWHGLEVHQRGPEKTYPNCN